MVSLSWKLKDLKGSQTFYSHFPTYSFTPVLTNLFQDPSLCFSLSTPNIMSVLSHPASYDQPVSSVLTSTWILPWSLGLLTLASWQRTLSFLPCPYSVSRTEVAPLECREKSKDYNGFTIKITHFHNWLMESWEEKQLVQVYIFNSQA